MSNIIYKANGNRVVIRSNENFIEEVITTFCGMTSSHYFNKNTNVLVYTDSLGNKSHTKLNRGWDVIIPTDAVFE